MAYFGFGSWYCGNLGGEIVVVWDMVLPQYVCSKDVHSNLVPGQSTVSHHIQCIHPPRIDHLVTRPGIGLDEACLVCVS